MQNKKSKSQKQNNIVVNADFDYDKLAIAILEAQQAKSDANTPTEPDNTRILKKIWLILRGKKDTKERFTIGMFSLLTSFLLKAVSLIGLMFTIYEPIYVFKAISKMTWINYAVIWNIAFIVMAIMFFVIFLMSTLIIYIASIEIEKTEDKNLIFATFSGMTSLVALIVAFVALYK